MPERGGALIGERGSHRRASELCEGERGDALGERQPQVAGMDDVTGHNPGSVSRRLRGAAASPRGVPLNCNEMVNTTGTEASRTRSRNPPSGSISRWQTSSGSWHRALRSSTTTAVFAGSSETFLGSGRFGPVTSVIGFLLQACPERGSGPGTGGFETRPYSFSNRPSRRCEGIHKRICETPH